MLNIKVEIENIDKLKAIPQRFSTQGINELNNAVKQSVFDIHKEVLKEAPVNKNSGGGNLRQSFKTKFGRLWGEIFSNIKYAVYVHEGTRPHIIRAVNKRVLADRRAGVIFGKEVKHPGTLPNPFLKRAIENAKSKIESNFGNAIRKILKLK